MARTEIPTYDLTDGLEVTGVSVTTAGGMMRNDGHTAPVIRNAATTSATVTVVAALEVDGLDMADNVLTIAGGKTLYLDMLPTAMYNQINEYVWFDVSATVTIGGIRV